MLQRKPFTKDGGREKPCQLICKSQHKNTIIARKQNKENLPRIQNSPKADTTDTEVDEIPYRSF